MIASPRKEIVIAGVVVMQVSDDDMLDLVTPAGDVLVSVNEFARAALGFVAHTGAFYVRELPGELTDDEKVALIATLVEYRILREGG